MKHLLISIVGMLSIYTSNAQQVIDVHCHNIFPEFTEFLERHGAAMKETFPLPQWDIDTHLEFMENAGIGKAILSMSAPQPYYGNTDECTRILSVQTVSNWRPTVAGNIWATRLSTR